MSNLRGKGMAALIISTVLFGASCVALGLSLWGIAIFLLIALPVQWLLSSERTWGYWALAATGFLAGAISPILTVVILAPCVYVGTVYGALSVLKLSATRTLTEWESDEPLTATPKQKSKKPPVENGKEAASPFPWDPKSPHYQVTHDPKLNLISGNIYNLDE